MGFKPRSIHNDIIKGYQYLPICFVVHMDDLKESFELI